MTPLVYPIRCRRQADNRHSFGWKFVRCHKSIPIRGSSRATPSTGEARPRAHGANNFLGCPEEVVSGSPTGARVKILVMPTVGVACRAAHAVRRCYHVDRAAHRRAGRKTSRSKEREVCTTRPRGCGAKAPRKPLRSPSSLKGGSKGGSRVLQRWFPKGYRIGFAKGFPLGFPKGFPWYALPYAVPYALRYGLSVGCWSAGRLETFPSF